MRGKHFNPKFMAGFEEELAKISKKPPPLGVPDCGNGKFSEKLSHKDWLEYNTVMYLAQSAIQSIYANLLITLTLGIYSNAAGIIVGLFLIVYRIAYSVGGRVSNSLLPVPLTYLLAADGFTQQGQQITTRVDSRFRLNSNVPNLFCPLLFEGASTDFGPGTHNLADTLTIGWSAGEGGDALTVAGAPDCPVEGNLVLLLLGARRLPEIGRSVGEAIREFQRAMRRKS